MSKRFGKQPIPRGVLAYPFTSKIETDLRNAIALHQRGHFAKAEQIYRGILKEVPNHFDAQHLLGVLRHQQGRNVEALELIRAALKTKPSDPRALFNCGVVLSALKRFDKALASYDKAIANKSDYAEALNNRGNVLNELNRFEEALASCNKAIALQPGYAGAFNNRGIALNRLMRFEEALASYDKAIALKSDYAEAFNNRGLALGALMRFEEALASYDKAIRFQPNYAEAFNNRGFVLGVLRQFEAALACFDQAIALQPDNAEAFNNRGNALRELKRFDEALASYDRAIALTPDYATAFNNRGIVLRALKRFDEALASYSEALAIKPDYAEALHHRAIELMALGRLAEAERDVNKAIGLAPRRTPFYRTLGTVSRYVAGDARVALMEELAQDVSSLSVDERIELHFALGNAYEDLGRPEHAFSQWLVGNALKRNQITYDETATLEMHERIREVFTPQLFQTFGNIGETSQLPIFIVGMPRSGTTLIEQILASHPDVFGGGELDYLDLSMVENGLEISHVPVSDTPAEKFRQLGESYLAKIKQLAPAAARVVDKLPGNYPNIGLIHLALPNASIIHAVRDPVDTCISCFSKLFTNGQNYTYDLGELGRYYWQYRTLMAHWHHVLPPGRIIDVHYEELVSNLEEVARRLVAHCGLGWNARCLSFHQTERPVRTGSVTQVRQPIYKGSVGRRSKYESFLAPLLVELSALRSFDPNR